jgi:hypothetical protein
MRAAGWVIAVCVLAATLGWWTKAHCLVDGGWQDVEQYTRWCYTDVYPLWRAEELDKGAVPYFDHEVEYPVLTGAQMYLGQQAVRLLGGGGVRFYTVTSLINGAAALATLLALAATGLPRRRLLWWTAVPTFIVYVTLNWDPVAVLLLTLAVLAHLRGRNALAGVAAGLGVAAKATPGVVIPFIALGLLRARRVRAALVHVGAAALAWTLCNVGIAVAAPEGWLEFFRLNRRRPADFDSLWYLAEQLRGARFDVATLNLVSGALVLAGWAVIAVIGLLAPVQPLAAPADGALAAAPRAVRGVLRRRPDGLRRALPVVRSLPRRGAVTERPALRRRAAGAGCRAALDPRRVDPRPRPDPHRVRLRAPCRAGARGACGNRRRSCGGLPRGAAGSARRRRALGWLGCLPGALTRGRDGSRPRCCPA